MHRILLCSAAISAATAVAAGAFGAHMLGGQGDMRAADLFKTASQYQFGHAVAVIAILAALPAQGPWPAGLMLVGSLIFALSIYALALGAPSIVGPITPIGGALMILAWLLLAWRFATSAE